MWIFGCFGTALRAGGAPPLNPAWGVPVRPYRHSEFIQATRALGARDARILVSGVLLNIAPPLLVFVSLNLGALIVETAGLSFIGLGAQPPTADWGTMLADGRQFMMTAPHVAAIPGLGVLALVWGLNMLGDGLRDMLDPTLAHTIR